MNFFELILKIQNRRSPHKWATTTATFTGKHEQAVVRTNRGPKKAAYNAWEIVYTVDDKIRHGWYTFHPLPDPEEIAGTEIAIRYQRKKPYIFEAVRDLE